MPERAAPKPVDLAMVPLAGKTEGSYDDGKTAGSSTEFFAIPHAARAGRLDGPPSAPPSGPQPVAAAAMMSGPVPMGPVPVAGIQGPVAVGPVGAGGAVAYGGGDPGLDGGRTQSLRVFGVITALVVMVCGALVITVGLVIFAVVQKTQPPPPPPILEQPRTTSREPIAVDTGTAKPLKPKPTVASVPKPATPRPASTGPKPAPAPAPAANGASAAGVPGTLTVRIPPDVHATFIEIKCNSGFRERASFEGGVAVRNDVPAERCEIFFKGGTINTKLVTNGPRSFNCTSVGPADLDCN